METKATKDGDHYILNGSKTWITNSPIADVFVIWAKDDNGDIRGFILEKDFKGLSAPKLEVKIKYKFLKICRKSQNSKKNELSKNLK
jgi:glutaryl-CoA dehydrogenase